MNYTGLSGLTGERGSWSVECILRQQTDTTVISIRVQKEATSITGQEKENSKILRYVILDCRVDEQA